jgi:hypothetical protein
MTNFILGKSYSFRACGHFLGFIGRGFKLQDIARSLHEESFAT